MFYILTFVLTQQGFAKRKNVGLTSHLKCIFEILQIRHNTIVKFTSGRKFLINKLQHFFSIILHDILLQINANHRFL